MDLEALPAQWQNEANQQPMLSSNDVDIRLTLRRCANQLELALHQYMHEAEFRPGCRFCDWETEHNANYPEVKIELR